MGMPWTDRLEAVKFYVFDLDGNVAATHHESKRVPGCYTLPEAIKLTRSADLSQQEAALLLIAAVLYKAIDGLQAQQLSSNSRSVTETKTDTAVDWQAVWTYAVGPGLELASSLRFALDDSNLSVVTACAKALQALLSCSANEAIFGLQESIWPGNKSAFTAPVFRRKTELDEGFIGGGRWKYHVSAIDLYPVTQILNPLSDTEEDKDSIGDEAAVTSKDVAAGLLRMDILTRIQYIFEREQLRSADENLLCVVIALSRHSPAAAKAVMKCPRLMDSIIQRFLLIDEDLNGALRSAHTKAIQLLKILSQASAANCIRFAETGALQVAQCELYKQGFPLPSDPRLGEESFKGICATVVECLRLWRVCINHQIGIALFPDIYPTLCYWLAPLSCKEISSTNSGDMLFLAQESYSLLERLAWTLPVLPTQGSIHVNWAWKTALPLVETASGWLSKDRISAVSKELITLASQSESGPQNPERCFRMKLVATMASVFHFLGTVCEMFTESGSEASTKKSLHPVVNQLAIAVASNGLLTFRTGKQCSTESPNSLLEILLNLWEKVDEETAMTVSSCIHGLVRLLIVTDQLCQPFEDKTGLLAEGSKESEILSRGLVSSADRELRDLLSFFGDVILDTEDLRLAGETQPAPGLGLGWGQVGGGVWSKRGLHVKGVARLVMELLEVLPSSKKDGDKTSTSAELMWRINCCLRIAAVFGPGDVDMVYRMCSNILLHPDTLASVFQCADSTLKAEVGAVQNGSHHVYDEISKMLLEHYRKVWMCARPDKASTIRQGNYNKKLKTSLIATKLSNLSEESAKLSESKSGMEGLANDMVAEWAKQRLPLPPHYVFSPMVINLSGLIDGTEKGNGPECKMLEDGKFVISQDKEIGMEDAIERGAAWILGLEVLSQSLSTNDRNVFAAIPLVRKLHSLSSLFLLGGEMFLRSTLKNYVTGLQRLYGKLLDAPGLKALDFEGEVDGGYCTFVEALATKFSSSSSTDTGFARQVAVYLRQDVVSTIRLQTWQALARDQSLHRLPPLSDCCGDPSGYLSPPEKNNQMIEAFVSAWTSGALDAVDGKSSMASEIAIHHIAALFFEEGSATDKTFLREIAKTLFGTSNQELLRKFLERSLSWPAEPLSAEELKKRLSIIQAIGEGDNIIMDKVKELHGVLFQSTIS
ncbi:hypothetical protein KC19_6G133500 [Ceratodon purpureus]|uniref:RPAP1/MINIYO-like TPR repeats domain-containing protein n=1 Tax=Ceratodon purpureus TaxID=3225 RepID=A0A8T0HH35_CERPU|nr:hypothetical protein KC19_6G133500 [Ceratodon purpureus]